MIKKLFGTIVPIEMEETLKAEQSDGESQGSGSELENSLDK